MAPQTRSQTRAQRAAAERNVNSLGVSAVTQATTRQTSNQSHGSSQNISRGRITRSRPRANYGQQSIAVENNSRSESNARAMGRGRPLNNQRSSGNTEVWSRAVLQELVVFSDSHVTALSIPFYHHLLPESELLELNMLLQHFVMHVNSSPSPSSNEAAYNDAVNEYIAQRETGSQNAPHLNSRNPLMCNICLCPYRDREPTAVQCGHVYCRECVEHHLENQNAKCIVCNAVMTRQLTRLFP